MITELDIFQKECAIEFDELSLELSMVNTVFIESASEGNIITKTFKKIRKILSDLKAKLNEFFLNVKIKKLEKELEKSKYKNLTIEIPDYNKLCEKNNSMLDTITGSKHELKKEMEKYKKQRNILLAKNALNTVTLSAGLLMVRGMFKNLVGREMRLQIMEETLQRELDDASKFTSVAKTFNSVVSAKLSALQSVSKNESDDILNLTKAVANALNRVHKDITDSKAIVNIMKQT